MRKKILCLLLSFVLCLGTLSGCMLFENDPAVDMQQVVAEIAPITETREIDGKTVTFTSEKKLIYKSQLISKFKQVAADLIQNQQYTVQQAYEYSLQMLVIQKLIEIEADKRLEFGEMEWKDYAADENREADYTDYNTIQKLIYNTVDSQLNDYKNSILSGFGEPTFTPETESDTTSTTYPVMPAEGEDEDVVVKESTKWVPSKTRYPGYGENQAMASLELTAFDRFINWMNKVCKDDFRATSDDQKKFKQDMERIEEVKNSKGYSEVYGILGELYITEWVYGKTAKEQVKMSKLQERVTDDATVTREQVVESFDRLKNGQTARYKTVSNYHTDIKDGKTTIVVHPTTDYFYVNHILLPFSTEQKALLDAAKKDPLATEASIEQFRRNLVDQIVAYPHVDGEDDKTSPMTVKEIMSEIRSAMAPYSADISKGAEVNSQILRGAERTFDELVYKYNTDTASIGKREGYVVKKKLADGEAETYMKEFALKSRELEENQRVGTFLDEMVITDYGVHILYLNKTIDSPVTYEENDYVTYGEFKTFYDLQFDTLLKEKQDKVFEEFQGEILTNNEKKVTKYTNRFKDLYE